MKPTRTAFRYAKATLAYSNENKVSDKVAKEMQGLIEFYESSVQLNRLLSDPFLSNTKKTQRRKVELLYYLSASSLGSWIGFLFHDKHVH